MADYNQHSGYTGQRPPSTYNAHQDEFGFKEGSDYPADGGYGDQKFQPSSGQGQGYGGSLQDATDPIPGYGDTDAGVGGPKSTYGASREGVAYDDPTSEQSQFGLDGKTGYGHEGSDPTLGGTDTTSYGASDPLASQYDDTPRSNTQTVPGGDGWSAEDTSRTHGAKKDGLMNKIKEKMPGDHNTATSADPNAPPKKGMMEKIKEKLPGQHGSDSGM